MAEQEPQPIWYYRLKDTQGKENGNLMCGPITVQELLRLGKSGDITPNTMIRAGISGPWIRFSAFQSAPQAFSRNKVFTGVALLVAAVFVLLSFTGVPGLDLKTFIAKNKAEDSNRQQGGAGALACGDPDDTYGAQLERSKKEFKEKEEEHEEARAKLVEEQKEIRRLKSLPAAERPADYQDQIKKYNDNLRQVNRFSSEQRERKKYINGLEKIRKEKGGGRPECGG